MSKFLKVFGSNTFKKGTFRILNTLLQVSICEVLCDLVPFVQFEKCREHLWRSVTLQPATLLKVTLLVFFTFLKLCKWYQITQRTLHKKWSFPLRISSVNVTKFGFGHIYWKYPWWKTSFFVEWHHIFIPNTRNYWTENSNFTQ